MNFPTGPAWTVHIYENGKHLGRLTPEGGTTRRTIHATMFPESRAREVAAEINANGGFPDDMPADEVAGITARASRF